jgi:hypothetical protein
MSVRNLASDALRSSKTTRVHHADAQFAVSAFLWARFGAPQAERHLAIVDPLLVTRLADLP